MNSQILNDAIVQRLTEAFPGNYFEMKVEVNSPDFKPYVRLIANGKQTILGYQLEAVEGLLRQQTITEQEYAAQWVDNSHSSIKSGFVSL